MSAPVTFVPPPGYFAPMLSFGAAFVGFSVASFLMGCMTVQCYLYFSTRNATTDPAWLKTLVVAVWSIGFTQVLFQGHYIYSGLIINFGNLGYFSLASWSLNAFYLLSILYAALVQLFYARRLYILGKESRVLPAIVVLLTIIGFGFGIALIVSIFKHQPLASFEWIAISWLSLITATDLCISVGMFYQLRSRMTGFESTDKMLDRLVVWIVNTGVVTTLTEVACLAAFIAASHSFAHICFNFIAPTLYANSFFGILNARIFINNYEGQMLHTGSSNSTSGTYTKDKVQVHVHSTSHDLSSISKPEMDRNDFYRTTI